MKNHIILLVFLYRSTLVSSFFDNSSDYFNHPLDQFNHLSDQFNHLIVKRELLKQINTISKNLTDNQTIIESLLPPIVQRAYGIIIGKKSKNKTNYPIANQNSTSLKNLAKNDMRNIEPIKRKRKFKIDTDKLNTPNLTKSLPFKKTRPSKQVRPIIRLDNLNSKDPFGLKKGNLASSEEQEEHCYQLIELTTLPIKIVSPNYRSGNYPSNSNCIYNLTSTETDYEQQIKLNIINLDLEDSKKCEHDYLQVLNSSIRFCGELKNKEFYLNQSSAILNFRSDITTEFKGFDIELSVESSDCRSLITLDHFEHFITSPNFPKNYPDSMNCWTLINGEKLQLEHSAKNPGYDDELSISFTFIELSMEPDSLCSIDYVELFEVNEDLEPRASLGRFCEYGKYIRIVGDKTNKKNQILTMGNQIQTRNPYLYLHFKTDKLINSRGFKAKIEVKEKISNKLNHTCDWHADSKNQKIVSPSFPHPYPSNIDCSLLIEAPTNDHFILLTFERFILEPDANCTFDRFLIYEPLRQNKKRRKRSPIGNQRTNFDTLDFRRFLIGNQVIRTSNRDSKITTNQTNDELTTKSSQQSKPKDLLTKTLEKERPSQIYCGKKESNSKYLSKGSKLVLRFVTDDFGEYLGFSIKYKFVDKEDAKILKDQLNDRSNDKLNDKLNDKFAVNQEDKRKDTVEYEFEPVDANITIGSSHILKCKPKGYSKLKLINNQFNQENETSQTIKWFKDDSELTDGLNADKTILLIHEFHLSSTGSYRCQFGKSSRKAWLKIKNETDCKTEILFQRRPQDQTTTEGDYPILECNAVAVSSPHNKLRTTWLHNGKPIESDQRIQFLPNNYLLLSGIKKEDAGYYHCQITDESNDKCQKVSIAYLQVRSKQNLEMFCGRSLLNKNKKESVQHHAKIVGGTEAIRGQYPWQVMFADSKRGSFCGGAVLSEKWIATAAHCFKPNPNSAPSPPTSQMIVKLGKHDQNIKEEGEFSTQISEIYLHPQYNPETFDNDLALIQIKDHLTFNEYIQPICLGTADLAERNFFNEERRSINFSPKMGNVAGWGQVRENGPSPRFMQHLQVPLVSIEDCKLSTSFKVTSNMFCAGYGEDTIGDSCKGDSGSPFSVKLDDSRFYLVGIVSWGEGCGKKNKYGFYTKVQNYLDWINALIQL